MVNISRGTFWLHSTVGLAPFGEVWIPIPHMSNYLSLRFGYLHWRGWPTCHLSRRWTPGTCRPPSSRGTVSIDVRSEWIGTYLIQDEISDASYVDEPLLDELVRHRVAVQLDAELLHDDDFLLHNPRLDHFLRTWVTISRTVTSLGRGGKSRQPDCTP